MHILFQDQTQIPIELNNSPVCPTILKIFKNLQHVTIPFRDWDNPFYLSSIDYKHLLDLLEIRAQKVGVELNRKLCLTQSQEYFNHLHKIYEQTYDGSPKYLDFHESIHLCEKYILKDFPPSLYLSYRETAGLLEQPFNSDWLTTTTTCVQEGDVYVMWAELGKSPYTYWENTEPNNITRIKELCKPWLKLRPKIGVAVKQKNLLTGVKVTEFNNWWAKYSDDWCRHWQISTWTVEQQHAVLVIGQVTDINLIVDRLRQKIYPIKIQL